MKKIIIAVVLAVLFVMPWAEQANAWKNSSNGTHSSSSKNSKPSGKFMRKKCKTTACFKKHPTGEYAIPLRQKK